MQGKPPRSLSACAMPPLCRAPRGAAPLLTAERAAPPCRGLEFRALIASTQNTYWTAPCPQTENNNSSSQTTEHLLVLQGAHTTLSPKVGRALGPKRREAQLSAQLPLQTAHKFRPTGHTHL